MLLLIEALRGDAAKDMTHWCVATAWQGQTRSRAHIDGFAIGGPPILHAATASRARHTNWLANPLIGERRKRVLQRFSHKGARLGSRLQAGHRLCQRNVGL